MSLAIEVGYFNVYPEADDDTPEVLEAINDLLVSNDLPPHQEPRDPPEMVSRASVNSFPYSHLHYLRRIAAHRMAGPRWMLSPCGDDGPDEEDDKVIEQQADQLSNHLLSHSDSEGFYVPVDFTSVLVDEAEDRLPGMALGSSQQLSRDLAAIAPLLHIQLDKDQLSEDEAAKLQLETLESTNDPHTIEKTVWFTLHEACRLSVENHAIIVFC